MVDLRRSTRRTSDRIAEKEDAQYVNGVAAANKVTKDQANGTSTKQGTSSANNVGSVAVGGRGKRKYGTYELLHKWSEGAHL